MSTGTIAIAAALVLMVTAAATALAQGFTASKAMESMSAFLTALTLSVFSPRGTIFMI